MMRLENSETESSVLGRKYSKRLRMKSVKGGTLRKL